MANTTIYMPSRNSSAGNGSAAITAATTTPPVDAYFTVPVKLLQPDDAYTTFVLCYLLYALLMRTTEFIVSKNPHLLPKDLPPTKKYDALFRFTRCFLWSLAALCALPSVGTMVDYVFNDDVIMTLPSRFVMRLLEIAVGFSVVPIFYDLCGRRDMHWTTLVHHVATCLCAIVNADWNFGTSIAIYHCMTCFFVLPLDFALGLCVIQAPVPLCVKWLILAKYTAASVFTLAQVGILRSLWKMFYAYAAVATYSKTSLVGGFALVFVLDITLVATQCHIIYVLHGMARKRQAAQLSSTKKHI